MTGFIEDQLLRFEGLDDNDIKAVNEILPLVQRLDVVLTENWSVINKVITTLLPIIGKIAKKQQELKI